MSVITLSDAKAYLDVIHSYDDPKLQLILDAAEDEAARFLNLADLSSFSPVPMSITMGVILLMQASYQAAPDDVPKFRSCAEAKLMPYRTLLGI